MYRTIGGEAMGGPWFVKIACDWPEAELHDLIQGELDAVETAMSPWREEAEINRVGRAPAGEVQVSAQLAEVLAWGLDLQSLSRGAFSPVLGAEVSAAGFGPAGVASLPPARLSLKGQTLFKSGPVRFDLCALAKGYGVDCAAAALRASGAENFLLNVSGDLYASGKGPMGAWTVGLELPLPDRQVIARTLPLTGAVATSGTYLKKHADPMKRSCHLLDGRRGVAVDHGLISVAVLHDTALLADGWATTLTVLGPEAGPALARQQGIAAVFTHQTEGGFREEVTMAGMVELGSIGELRTTTPHLIKTVDHVDR